MAFGGGAPGPVAGDTNTIEFITIATLGNAMDFGDCTSNGGDRAGCASSTKAISAKGGSSSDTAVEYVQIMSTGNAQDFGDLNQGTYESGSLSNDLVLPHVPQLIIPVLFFAPHFLLEHTHILIKYCFLVSICLSNSNFSCFSSIESNI